MLTVFPHVPKCAGTTLRVLLEQSALKCRFDYDHRPSSDERWAKTCRQANREARDWDAGDVEVVFGHFPATRYAHLDGQLIGLLRHPVDRAYSHFLYYRDMVPAANVKLSHEPVLIRAVRSGEFGFLDFCDSPLIRSLYREHYFSGITAKDFALIARFERFDEALASIARILGIPMNRKVHERGNPRSQGPPGKIRAAAAVLLRDEVEWFESMTAFTGAVQA